MIPWLGHTPRRWQPEALDAVRVAFRAGGTRVVVQAATGAGKSVWLAEAAGLSRGSVLVTTPTQQLVDQLAATFAARCGEVGKCYQHEWQPEARVVVTCAASLPRLLAERPTWDLHLADEAHRRLPAAPAARWAVALTATPFRGMSGWERLAYAYSAADATRDGVLVPLRAVRYDGTHEHLPEDTRTDAIVREWVASAEGPGIITAPTVADAEAFAASCPGVAVVSGYQPRALRAERIAALMAGVLRALVSVRLLSEGVDLPALRWLALRSPVSSPVQLVQLVGRVLRAAPGKDHATVYDPHNALARVGLTHTAALDDVLAEAPEDDAEQWEIPELEGLGLAGLPAPVVVAAFEGWVSDLRASLAGAGWDLPRKPTPPDKATHAQRRALAALSGRSVGRLPEECRAPFRWLLEHPELSARAAQDAIDVLGAVWARWKREHERTGKPYWRLSGALVPAVPSGALVAA